MSTIDVGVGEFRSDAFLPSVDDFAIGPGGLNLGKVMGFDGITEDNPHGNSQRLRDFWY
jgi:hypothetical protein